LGRALVVPAALVVSLVGASSVAAAEPGPTTIAPTAVVAGTGTLAARGSGVARLGGSYVLVGAMDGGSIRIVGAGPLATVRVTGWASKTRLADGTLIYRGVHGTFHIAGRTIRTTIASTAMRFVATGHGRAVLRGHGRYWVNGVGPFPWSDDPLEAAF
jgi:uncharacterized Zn-binding protein involved in type VI secretion